MAFKVKQIVRSEIELGGKISEQVRKFNYLGCKLNICGEPDTDKKINVFQSICGSIRRHLKKTRGETQNFIK
jgi:hypothetical protein